MPKGRKEIEMGKRGLDYIEQGKNRGSSRTESHSYHPLFEGVFQCMKNVYI